MFVKEKSVLPSLTLLRIVIHYHTFSSDTLKSIIVYSLGVGLSSLGVTGLFDTSFKGFVLQDEWKSFNSLLYKYYEFLFIDVPNLFYFLHCSILKKKESKSTDLDNVLIKCGFPFVFFGVLLMENALTNFFPKPPFAFLWLRYCQFQLLIHSALQTISI